MRHHFRNTRVQIQELGARPGGHYLDDLRVVGLQQLVYECSLRSIQLPLLGNLFHKTPKFIHLQYILGCGLFPDHQGSNTVRHAPYDPTQRGHQLHPQTHRRSDHPRSNTDGIRNRDGLRCHLPKQQQQGDKDQGGDPTGFFRSVEVNQDTGHVGRRSHINQFIAAQNRNNQPARLIQKGVYRLGIRIAFFAKPLKIEAGKRKESRFRA